MYSYFVPGIEVAKKKKDPHRYTLNTLVVIIIVIIIIIIIILFYFFLIYLLFLVHIGVLKVSLAMNINTTFENVLCWCLVTKRERERERERERV